MKKVERPGTQQKEHKQGKGKQQQSSQLRASLSQQGRPGIGGFSDLGVMVLLSHVDSLERRKLLGPGS